MSHTPGPWHEGKTPGGSTRQVNADATGRLVATLGGLYDDQRVKADARLIAAAPDLLDAARNAHATLTLNPDTLIPGSGEWHTMERLLAFAIEKATGVSVNG